MMNLLEQYEHARRNMTPDELREMYALHAELVALQVRDYEHDARVRRELVDSGVIFVAIKEE